METYSTYCKSHLLLRMLLSMPSLVFFFPILLLAKNIGDVDAPQTGANISRSGNVITYSWPHWDSGHHLSITLNFRRGYDFMQKAYRYTKHRPSEHLNFNSFIANDPFKSDLYVVASALIEVAECHSLNPLDIALSFVQAFPYQEGMGSYQRYAVETLIDGRGDCSDTSVLFAGIVEAMNYESILLGYPDHLAVGVWTSRFSGTYYTYNGNDFYFCETTGFGFEVGEVPKEHMRSARIVNVAIMPYCTPRPPFDFKKAKEDRERSYTGGYTYDEIRRMSIREKSKHGFHSWIEGPNR